MCGVACGVGVRPSEVEAALDAIAHRGPDARGVSAVDGAVLGHVRLSIIDLDPRSDQPMKVGGTTVSYNGELWNYRELRSEMEAGGRSFSTASDTEVIAAALDEWGEGALPRLAGMFAVAWWDGSELRVARDSFGEVPIHVAPARRGSLVACSELRGLAPMGADPARAGDVGPGEMVNLTTGRRVRFYRPPVAPSDHDLGSAARELRRLLERSCAERRMADVPVCCLLSGGVDSSTIAALLRPLVSDLVAYTAVMDERSPDLRSAREVAAHLGIELREVRIPKPTAGDLAGVVRTIEMPFKAQVEIGWACVKLAEAMRFDGFKVTFSGEGSDELWGSYGFAYHALKRVGWHEYRRDLFLDQARKNFPRCNKIFMARSIECRLPFLNRELVAHALSLTREAVQDGRSRPKAVLQTAVEDLLPAKIVRRQKVAFQDALGMKRAAAEAVADPRRFYAAEHRAAMMGG